MFSWLQIGAGAALGILVTCVPVYMYGKVQGRHEAEIAQLRATVEAHIKREGVDNEVSAMDKYAICVDLGGLPAECDELRRLEESTEAEQPPVHDEE